MFCDVLQSAMLLEFCALISYVFFISLSFPSNIYLFIHTREIVAKTFCLFTPSSISFALIKIFAFQKIKELSKLHEWCLCLLHFKWSECLFNMIVNSFIPKVNISILPSAESLYIFFGLCSAPTNSYNCSIQSQS